MRNIVKKSAKIQTTCGATYLHLIESQKCLLCFNQYIGLPMKVTVNKNRTDSKWSQSGA